MASENLLQPTPEGLQLCCHGPPVGWRMGRAWWSAPGSPYRLCILYCVAWASRAVTDSLPLLSPRLSRSPVSRSVHHSGNGVAVCLEFQVSLALLVCLQCPLFPLGVLALCSLKKSLQTIKWKYSAVKKEYGSSLAWLVFCLAFVKMIQRHSLDNLRAWHCGRQAVVEDREVTDIPPRGRLEAFLT